MEPQQPYGSFPAPPNGNPYDFITNSAKPPKPSGPLPSLKNSNSLVGKLVVIIGGAIVVIVVLVIIVNVVFGGQTNLGTVLKLAETQQEIIRVTNLAANNGITDDTVAGSAISTKLAVTTQQQNLVAYLTEHRQKVDSKTLALKKDTTSDQRIAQAKATSTLNIVFPQIVRQQLIDYSAEIKTNYNNATSQSLKKILATDYNQTQLLLKQWPTN
jgi:hypothetical protein